MIFLHMVGFCVAGHNFSSVSLPFNTIVSVHRVVLFQFVVLLLLLDAVRRIFVSKSEEFSLKANGKYDIKVKKQRRRNRIMKVRHCTCT